MDQSAPHLGKIFMFNRIQMSVIMAPIGLQQLSYLLLNWQKLPHSILLSSIYKYKPISTKLGHSEYEHRSQMSLIMGQVIPDQSVLPVLEIEKLNFINISGIYFHC